MKAVENNVSYKDGDEIQPLSVDLSGQKTVVTGGDIVIEMSEEMLNRETAKYYFFRWVYLSIKVKRWAIKSYGKREWRRMVLWLH